MNYRSSVFDNINAEIRRHRITQDIMCEQIGINKRTFSGWPSMSAFSTVTERCSFSSGRRSRRDGRICGILRSASVFAIASVFDLSSTVPASLKSFLTSLVSTCSFLLRSYASFAVSISTSSKRESFSIS